MWRVLIVDDAAAVRQTIQAALTPFGMDFGQAADGRAAVAAAAHEPWDLIFLDVVMPELDGPAALAQIRAAGCAAPVILISSGASATAIAPAVKLGGVTYLAKPFTPDQVRRLAARALQQDEAALARAPHVLLHRPDPEVHAALRAALPPHVALHAAPSLAASLERIERARQELRPVELVLLDTRTVGDDEDAIAAVIRRDAPAAAVFIVDDDATPAALWRPAGAIDGRLARAIDRGAVRDCLYGLMLRPLVLFSGRTARVARFPGPPALRDAYVMRVVRLLLARSEALDPTEDFVIDVTQVGGGADEVVAIAGLLDATLRAAGMAPKFRTSTRARRETTGRLPTLIVTE